VNALAGKWACRKDGAHVERAGRRDSNRNVKGVSYGVITGSDPIDDNKGTYSVTTGHPMDTIT